MRGFDSTVLCLIASYDSEGAPTRVAIEPSPENGLRKRSWVMADKICSSRKDELGERPGALSEAEMRKVSAEPAKVLFLFGVSRIDRSTSRFVPARRPPRNPSSASQMP